MPVVSVLNSSASAAVHLPPGLGAIRRGSGRATTLSGWQRQGTCRRSHSPAGGAIDGPPSTSVASVTRLGVSGPAWRGGGPEAALARLVAVDCLGERGCGERHDHAHIATIGLTVVLASQESTGLPQRRGRLETMRAWSWHYPKKMPRHALI